MLTVINGYPVNTQVVNAGRTFTQAVDEDRYVDVYAIVPVGVFGTSIIEEIASVKIPAVRTILNDTGPFDRVVTVIFDNDMVRWPASQAIEIATVFAPVYVKRWGSLYINPTVDVEAPFYRVRWGLFTPEELVTVWLRDWSDARERRRGSKLFEVSLLFVSAIIKMWSYPIVADTDAWAASAVKKSFSVDIIDEYAEVYSGGDIKSWYYPIETNSKVTVGGVVRKSTPYISILSDSSFTTFGNLITVNASLTEEKVTVNTGDTLILYDGSIKLEPCSDGRLVEELIPCTPDCPVYP